MRVAVRSGAGPLLVAVSLAVNNLAGYAVTVLAARLLAPAQFGEFGALLAVLLVGVVPAMGVQAVVALRVASGSDDRRLTGLGLAVAVAVVVAAAAAAGPVGALLRVESPLALAAALAPMTLNGLWYGLLQGRRRFPALAGLLLLESGCRVGGAVGGLLLGGPAAAVLGIAAGVGVATVAGWVVCGRPTPVRPDRELLRSAASAAQALLALVVLVNLDLVLARHVLSPADAGEYAVGAVVLKIAYWLPHAVSVVVLPELARPGQADRRRVVAVALAVVAGLDALVVAGAALFGPLGLRLLGGPAYAGSDLALWPFALAGALLALSQVLLYTRIARADHRSLLTWAAVAVEAALVLGWLDGSPTQVAAAAVAATGVLALAGGLAEAGVSGAHRRRTTAGRR
ncbi:polysaccharide biosynthesis protein [Actinokineospora sp. NPDC004072]